VPRAEPFALGKSSLCRELGIWLSAQKRALGRGRVSGSDILDSVLQLTERGLQA
jgi:hypothetical protein